MRILWIVEGGLPPPGNADTVPVLDDVCRALGSRAELRVIALGERDAPGEWERHGVPIRDLSAYTKGSRTVALATRAEPFDVVHALGLGTAGRLGLSLALRHRKPLVASLWGGELEWLPDIGYGGARSWRSAAARTVARQAARVTAPSRIAGDKLACDYVPLELLPDLGADAAPVADSDVLLTVADITPVKDPTTLLRAFAEVARDFPRARLRWVGRDHLDGTAARLAADLRILRRVDWVGFLPHEAVRAEYEGAGVYVQSSRFESQGVSVAEAAGFGLALVGTHVGTLADLAPDAALTVPPCNPNALATALASVLGNPVKKRALAEGARRWRAGRGAMHTAEKLLSLYESVR
jgi:glycosyltransferase involved in cell wall biosynthesis